jgi:hypothetical protein
MPPEITHPSVSLAGSYPVGDINESSVDIDIVLTSLFRVHVQDDVYYESRSVLVSRSLNGI